MRISFCALFLGLAAAAGAETASPDCAALTATLQGVQGYELTAPPAGPEDGWCVLDGATLRSTVAGWPNLSADRLRLARGEDPAEIALEVTGLRIAPKAGDPSLDDRLRAVFRLQTADLALTVTRNDAAGTVALRDGLLRLSGGTEIGLSADIKAAELAPQALAAGSLLRLALDWRNDGRLLRPVMEIAGQRLTGADGGAAVDAARAALVTLLAALPDSALTEDSRTELEQLIAALPQGRGKLRLVFTSADGVGAARVGMAVLSGDPFGPKALAGLLDGALIEADWQPGLAP